MQQFANLAINVGPGSGNQPHCLARNGDSAKTINTGQSMVDACNSRGTFADMAGCAEGGAHAWGHNGVGAVIVNNIQGAGAMEMALPFFTPSIPVISLSYERGLQIIQALNATGSDTTPDLGYFDFSARWDPDPIVAPEPASLLLLSAGLAGLTAARRTRRR